MGFIRHLAVCAALVVIAGTGAQAAENPSLPAKPIRFIVPNPPGGGLDITARLIAPKLSQSLNRTFVVDNRGGATGVIALETTARATPDGSTVIIISASQEIHALINKTPYDFFRDFAPVSNIVASPYLLAVWPGLPAKSVKELIGYAKANPERLNYASAGNGSLQQLATELFANSVGIKVIHVPYKGVAAALPDFFSGRTQIMMSSLATFAAHIRAKTLRALAVTTVQRTPVFPDLPTMIEAGVPGFDVAQWHAMLAPAGTPQGVLATIHRAIADALKQPDVAAFLANDGTEAVGSSPQEFAAYLKVEREKWAKVIKQAGVQPD
jgi:tripartite-type tricarboxylate transporter receptor subunit TctC